MAFNMRLVPPPPRQVLLYLLLMRERYAAEVSSGLLWNVCHERTDLVTYDPSLIASLMQGRNALIAHLTSPRAALPPMKQNERFCSKCSQNRACALMHKVCVRTLVVQGPAAHPCVWACSVRLTFQTQYVTRYQADEGGTAESAQMGDVFAKVTAHLSDTHLAFWRNMLRAVDLEEASQASRKAEIWTMSGACMCVPLRAHAPEPQRCVPWRVCAVWTCCAIAMRMQASPAHAHRHFTHTRTANRHPHRPAVAVASRRDRQACRHAAPPDH